MNDLTSADVARLVFYGAIALWMVYAIPQLFRSRILTGLLTLGMWLLALVAVLTAYSYRFELNRMAERVVATLVPGTPIATSPKEVTIIRGRDGQFLVRGTAGGSRLQFIFDTGASAIVLQAEDAARIGIRLRQLTFDIDVSTANGHALTAETRIPQLAIGSIVERDVPALVARPGAIHENLLGMSFLSRLRSFSVEDDRLVLKGR
jgi:aspartyl protease family protein